MDTLINLRPEELTEDFFKQLQNFATEANSIEIKIYKTNAINDMSETVIESRLQQFQQRKTVSFTPEEFDAYVHQIAAD